MAEEKKEISASSSSDEEEDDEFPLNHISRLKKGTANPNSLRRYDEFASFLTRSERSRQAPDKPPSASEEAKRRVHFDLDLNQMHQVEKHENPEHLFWQPDDFDAADDEVQMLHFRWENHVQGKIRLDPDYWTIRGLESSFDPNITRGPDIDKHRINVLEQINEQKRQQKYDIEAIRKASLQTSGKNREAALKMGQQDYIDQQQAWLPKELRKPDTSFGRDITPKSAQSKQKKKKKGFFGLFK